MLDLSQAREALGELPVVCSVNDKGELVTTMAHKCDFREVSDTMHKVNEYLCDYYHAFALQDVCLEHGYCTWRY